jgi:hypothetical protein
MEVRWFVIAIEDRDHDSEKSADLGHARTRVARYS